MGEETKDGVLTSCLSPDRRNGIANAMILALSMDRWPPNITTLYRSTMCIGLREWFLSIVFFQWRLCTYIHHTYDVVIMIAFQNVFFSHSRPSLLERLAHCTASVICSFDTGNSIATCNNSGGRKAMTKWNMAWDQPFNGYVANNQPLMRTITQHLPNMNTSPRFKIGMVYARMETKMRI